MSIATSRIETHEPREELRSLLQDEQLPLHVHLPPPVCNTLQAEVDEAACVGLDLDKKTVHVSTRNLLQSSPDADVSYSPPVKPEMEPSKQEWNFTLYDLDGTGQVTKEDMVTLMKSLYEAVGRTVKLPPQGSRKLNLRLCVSPEAEGVPEHLNNVLLQPKVSNPLRAEKATIVSCRNNVHTAREADVTSQPEVKAEQHNSEDRRRRESAQSVCRVSPRPHRCPSQKPAPPVASSRRRQRSERPEDVYHLQPGRSSPPASDCSCRATHAESEATERCGCMSRRRRRALQVARSHSCREERYAERLAEACVTQDVVMRHRRPRRVHEHKGVDSDVEECDYEKMWECVSPAAQVHKRRVARVASTKRHSLPPDMLATAAPPEEKPRLKASSQVDKKAEGRREQDARKFNPTEEARKPEVEESRTQEARRKRHRDRAMKHVAHWLLHEQPSASDVRREGERAVTVVHRHHHFHEHHHHHHHHHA